MSLFYFSSYRIPTPKTLYDLCPKKPDEMRVGIIINAKDYKPAEDRAFKLAQLSDDLANLKFTNQAFVDLRKYVTSEAISAELSNYDLLYIAGGSSPALKLAMESSFFEQGIRNFLDNGGVYVGESAGAYVAGPTIEVNEESDRHMGLPHFPKKGLALIDKIIIPHADNSDYQDEVKKMIATYGSESVVCLNDNQAYVINGDLVIKETGDNSRYDNRPRS